MIFQGISEVHAVNGNRMFPPFPEGTKSATFGMGCFWGVERSFWKIKGVYSTHVSPEIMNYHFLHPCYWSFAGLTLQMPIREAPNS